MMEEQRDYLSLMTTCFRTGHQGVAIKMVIFACKHLPTQREKIIKAYLMAKGVIA